MTFNSLAFAVFLPTVLLVYYRLDHRGQNRWLLAVSLFFYACWDWRFLSLLLITMVVDFFVASYPERLAKQGVPAKRRKAVLGISMTSNLAVLGFFKYFGFFEESLRSVLHSAGWSGDFALIHIVLPVGISFYTFQSMSYTIDVYRGELRPAKNFWDFALFVSFFPHLVAGPIMRAIDLLPQIIGNLPAPPRRPTTTQVRDGLHLMIWGFWKKMFVADNLAPIVNGIFTMKSADGFHTLVGVYAFAFQIYCDFSGYTDIARGVAKLMGFELVLNFNLPYFSTTPKEFWSRWHISLSTWLRNYLYIPLGGNRGGAFKTYRNLMLTMVLGGLWHGAAWNFVLWGFYQGVLLITYHFAENAISRRRSGDTATARSGWFCLSWLLMFHLTCYGWLLFRANSFAQIVTMTRSLFSPGRVSDPLLAMQVTVFIAPLIAMELFQYFSPKLGRLTFDWLPLEARLCCYSGLFYLAVFHAARSQSFIYFQF